MNVKRIDVTGESVVFHSGDNLLSGYESKLNFAIAAALSKQGKAIVALRSVDQEATATSSSRTRRNACGHPRRDATW